MNEAIEKLKKKWEDESDKLYPARQHSGMEVIDEIRDDLTILDHNCVVFPKKDLKEKIKRLEDLITSMESHGQMPFITTVFERDLLKRLLGQNKKVKNL